MPYTKLGKYQPAPLLQNIINATISTPRYELALPYLQAFKVQVEEAAIFSAVPVSNNTALALSNQRKILVEQYEGHIGMARMHIIDTLGMYAKHRPRPHTRRCVQSIRETV